MKVVITGGAGFIGTNLARRLRSETADLLLVDDLSTGLQENVDAVGATCIVGSILDSNLLEEAFAGASAVVHLAARPSVPVSLRDPMQSHLINATGTLQVLEVCRKLKVPYVVVASSSSVYGSNPVMPKSEDLTPMPMSPYAVSKLATESYALAYQDCFGMDTMAFRFFNVYGPFQRADHAYAAVVPAFVDAAIHNRPFTIHGDGLQVRDFTFVGDVVEVLAHAIIDRVCSPRPVNLAFGTRMTLLELAQEIEDVIGKHIGLNFVESRPGDVKYSQAEGTRLKKLFPDFSPSSLSVGLRETIEWSLMRS